MQNGAAPAAVLTARKVRPQFSASPSEQEIFQSGAFIEPLVPVGSGKASAAENTALASATLSFVDRTASSDTSALSSFLDAHPGSPWRASLLTNLGLRYRRSGYYSRALDCWEQAWNLAKNEKGAAAHNLADRALGELLALNASVGRQDRLKALLDEAGGRSVQGSVSTQIKSAKEALSLMQDHPETSFKCGPYALWRILNSQNNRSAANCDLIENFPSTARGVSLSQVAALSRSLGMNYQMAKRQPGAAFIVPAVVHWKVDHYAAITGRVGGRYMLEDPTFGQPIQVEEAALNEEASGYFIVPAGELPAGWQSVAEAEGDGVWGKGVVDTRDPDPTCPCDEQSGGTGDCAGCNEGPGVGAPNIAMPGYTVHSMPVSIHLTDSPVGYAPPIGPSVYLTVTYNQLETNQPTTPQYSNFGSLWTFNWLSYVTLDNGSGSGAHIYMRGGGTHNFPTANSTSSSGDAVTYPPNLYGQAILGKTTAGNYEQRMPDGSKEVFNLVDAAGRVFLRQMVDAQGNAVTLYYDADVYTDPQHPPGQPYRLHHITDALGQTTNFFYELTDDPYKITKVTDPFARSAFFGYTKTAGVYQLTAITDVIGMTSGFTYTGSNFLHLLNTPYGTTTFDNPSVANAYTRALEITDPYGAKERWENWIKEGNGIPSSDPDNVVPKGMYTRNSILFARSTYYWNKKAMLDDPSHPYTKARNYHFLHVDLGLDKESGILESEKLPLENRVWFTYPGQPYQSGSSPSPTQTTFDQGATVQGTSNHPNVIGRVLDDGTTQTTRIQYSADNTQVVSIADPVGRTMFFDYDTNGIDVLMKRQATGQSSSVILEKRVYDSTFPAHLPKQIIDASGRAASFTYNAQGRVLTSTNAKGETTTYSYTRPNANAGPADGYLYSSTGAISGATTSYTYDAAGRRNTVADTEGYQLAFEYDALNRLTKTTYPDAVNLQDRSYTKLIYDRLDVAWKRDRSGRWMHQFYDALRRVVAIQDPLGRITNFGYCLCGSMTSMTDAGGGTTLWNQDLQGRQISKTDANGKQVLYTYEQTTSRLASITDAMGQVASFTYYSDDKPKQTSYTNALSSTPTVNFTYDPYFSRVSSVIEGTGGTGTATYGYGDYSVYSSYSNWPSSPTTGAGMLTSETKTDTNGQTLYLISYGYDELGRKNNRKIDGMNNSASVYYDALGRVSSASNLLGNFGYDYTTATSPQIALMYLGSRTGLRTAYTYYPDSSDHLYHPNSQNNYLKSINNLAPSGGTISRFDYVYNPVGDIKTWTQQVDSQTPQAYSVNYDAADQLVTAVLRTTDPSQTLLKTQIYGYDQASNRISQQVDLNVTTTTPNPLNQIASVNAGGPVRFAGTVNDAAVVTVNGTPAQMVGNQFIGYANVMPGANTVTVSATNLSGQTTTNRYQVQVNSGAGQTLSYDSNGNLTNDGAGITYEWDALNRLVAMNYASSGNRTEFAYDAMSRRVKVVEKSGGNITSTKMLVWCGKEPNPSEERDGNNTVTKRFFMQGEQIGGINYYATHDHLGSVRELVDGTGAINARYAYDIYGQRTKVSGSAESSFGFTGYYYHAQSDLHLAMYRAYGSKLGRWISRDPLSKAELKQGPNLYSYAMNRPTNAVDPYGMKICGYMINRPIDGSGAAGKAGTICGASHQFYQGANGGPAASFGGNTDYNPNDPFTTQTPVSVPDNVDCGWFNACVTGWIQTEADKGDYDACKKNCKQVSNGAVSKCGGQVLSLPTWNDIFFGH